MGVRIGPLLALAGLVTLAALAVGAGAQEPTRLPPPPTGTRSAEVVDADTPMFGAPRGGAARLGTLARGTRVPVQARFRGPGCTGTWLQVGRDAYLCDRHTEYSARPPAGERHPSVAPGDLLPYDYAFVTTDGTRTFAHPSDYFADEYFSALGAGFGVILSGQTVYDGVPFVRTRRQLYIEANQVRHARGSGFQGVALGPEDPLDLAWVTRRDARIHERRAGRVTRRAGLREVLHVRDEARGWLELTDGTWIRRRDVARAEPSERPESAPADPEWRGTWIDVDVSEQVLVAYRGDRAVFATLVSTGRARPSHETPKGEHRLWVKLAYSDMDNLERDDVSENYALERVPWVQYFEGANGLHAAFWHDDFGRRKSHGCVNLSPRDARTLFDFTEPALPTGWTAIFPQPDTPATIVRVR
ncbi:MAG: hypothetical protein CMN30_04040 [Sandaracinus sp.]|nr:hypothetical protein [Sandaracinus sp.]